MTDKPTLAQKILAKKGVKVPGTEVPAKEEIPPFKTVTSMPNVSEGQKDEVVFDLRPEGKKAPKSERAPKEKPPKPRKPSTPPRETITYACGHSHGIRHITDQKCPECRQKPRVDQRKGPKVRAEDEGRWPDGTKVETTYDAQRQIHFGRLFVYVEPGRQDTLAIFNDEASGIELLMRKLGAQYRAWKANQTGEQTV